MVKDSKGVGTDVAANVTCSVCLNLFTNPKMMPGCLHSFCLDCLEMVPVKKKSDYWKVACPECRTVSKITGPKSKRGFEHLKTNMIAQNVVEAIRAQQKADGITGSCPHVLASEKLQKCSHCSRAYCTNCRLVHMEELKTEALEKVDKVVDENVTALNKDMLNLVDLFIETESSAVEVKIAAAFEAAKTAFDAFLTMQASKLRESFADLKKEQVELFHSKVELLSNPEKMATLRQMKEAIGSASVLKQNLEEVAKFSVEIDERLRWMNYFDSVAKSSSSPLFEWEENREAIDLLSRFGKIDIGSLKLSQLVDELVNPPPPVVKKAQPSPKLSDNKDESTTEKMDVVDVANDDADEKKDEQKQDDDDEQIIVTRRSNRLVRNRIVDDSDAEDDDSEDETYRADEVEDEEDVSDEDSMSSFIDDEALEGDEEEEEEDAEDEEAEDEEEEVHGDSDSVSSSGSQAVEVNHFEEDELVIDSCVKDAKAISLKDCHAVVAVPSKNAFGIMQASKIFKLIHPRTVQTLSSYEILCPINVHSIEIFDLAATEETDCIFLTSEVEQLEGLPVTRRIYRFWLGSRDKLELSLFAKSKSNDDFRGIAISPQLRYVFTTEGENLVAYSSTSTSRSQLGTRVFKCPIGPDPFVHAIYQTSSSITDVVCSSEKRLFDKVITTKEDGQCVFAKDKRWRDTALEDLRTVWPQLIALWDGNVLISKGYWLKKFSDFPRHPEFAGAFAPGYSSAQPLENCNGLAVLRSGSGTSQKDYVALINNAGHATISILPKNGSLVCVAEQI